MAPKEAPRFGSRSPLPTEQTSSLSHVGTACLTAEVVTQNLIRPPD
jgi:hypothetical protein